MNKIIETMTGTLFLPNEAKIMNKEEFKKLRYYYKFVCLVSNQEEENYKGDYYLYIKENISFFKNAGMVKKEYKEFPEFVFELCEKY